MIQKVALLRQSTKVCRYQKYSTGLRQWFLGRWATERAVQGVREEGPQDRQRWCYTDTQGNLGVCPYCAAPRRSVHVLEQRYLTKLCCRTLQELLLLVNQSRERFLIFACISLCQEKREEGKERRGMPKLRNACVGRRVRLCETKETAWQ